MSQQLISVIIPAYNCAKYLPEAIASVLEQAHDRMEIIVVDDGSTDGTADVVNKVAGVRYVYQENAGAAAARNTGVHAAQGELIAFLDADDVWMPAKLSLQLQALDQLPDLDMVLGHVQEFLSAGSSTSNATSIQRLREYAPGYVPGTLLIKTDAFWKVGEFSCTWRLGEFIDWYLRSQELGLRSLMLTEVVTRRRLHDTNLGIRARAAQVDYVAIIKAALDRRRKAHSI